jgi:hypothetical protein
LVVDDDAAAKTGRWDAGANPPVVGAGYVHDGNTGKGEKSVTFDVKVPEPGRYGIRLLYRSNSNRATNTPLTVSCGQLWRRLVINQREGAGGGTDLGTYDIPDTVIVTVSNLGTDGYVVVDGLQLLKTE